MNFLQTGFNGKNDWWMYGLMIVAMFFGTFIGQLPITVVAMAQVNGDMEKFAKSGESGFADIGIDLNLYLFLMLLGFIVSFFLFIVLLRGMHKKKLKWVITSRETIDWKRVFSGMAVWGILVLISLSIGLFLTPEDYVWNFNPVRFLILCVIALICIPIQTTTEEILFRGYYMQSFAISATKKSFGFILIYAIVCLSVHTYLASVYELNILVNLSLFMGYSILLMVLHYSNAFGSLLKSKFSEGLFKLVKRNSTPLILTSVIFGLLHLSNPEIDKLGYVMLVFYIGSGFFFGIVTLLDEGAEIAIGMHAINNILAALFITTNWTVFKTDALYVDMSEPTIDFEMFLPILVLYPAAILVFSKKYGWSRWKEKLFGVIVEPVEHNINNELGS